MACYYSCGEHVAPQILDGAPCPTCMEKEPMDPRMDAERRMIPPYHEDFDAAREREREANKQKLADFMKELGLRGLNPHNQTPAVNIKKLEEKAKAVTNMRTFDTGATRDSDEGKNDYEGFLSPLVLEAFGDYMAEHQIQSDGSRRSSDNWQKGIPINAYMSSMLRHVFDLWRLHRGWPVKAEKRAGVMKFPTKKTLLCSILFNVQGYLHELLKEEIEQAPGINAVCFYCGASMLEGELIQLRHGATVHKACQRVYVEQEKAA